MPSSETDPKPAQNPAEKDVQHTKEDVAQAAISRRQTKAGTSADLGADRESVVQRSSSEGKNVDRDGRERQPSQHADRK